MNVGVEKYFYPEINLNCVYINVFTFKEYYFLYGFF